MIIEVDSLSIPEELGNINTSNNTKIKIEETLIKLSSLITDPQSFYITKHYFEISLKNQKTEFLNELISNYLIKKKINIREIEVKMKNEEIRQEKEELKIRKNLEDKIDNALEKANLCLNNIKSFGKITQVISKGEQKPIKIKDLEQKDKNEKDPIDIIVSKIKNKYNEKIVINESNMNDYFFNIAKLKSKFKSAKQKNKILQSKAKNLKKIHAQVYAKSRKNWKPDSSTDFSFYKMLNFNYIDVLYKLISIINTELFEQLFIKIVNFSIIKNEKNEKKKIYESQNKSEASKSQRIKNENPNEAEYMNTLQDTFSFWYCLKFLLNLIESNQSLSNLNIILNPINENAGFKNENFSNCISLDEVIEKYNKSDLFGFALLMKNIYKNKNEKNLFHKPFDENLNLNVQKYLKFLNDKNLNKNSVLNENEIFDKRFYAFYENALKSIKLDMSKIAYSDLDNRNNIENNAIEIVSKRNVKGNDDFFTKQDLKFYKNLYSIFVNNSNYSFSIFKK